MPRLTPEIKEKVKSLTHNELQQIVLKLATKNKIAYDFIMVNYLDKDYGEQDLYDKTIADLNMLFLKGYRGFSQQLQMANMLTACIKRTNEFCSISVSLRARTYCSDRFSPVSFAQKTDAKRNQIFRTDQTAA